MASIWFASDHHFGHANLLKFTSDDGAYVRPGFRDVDHMNETMIANHNRVVGVADRAYFLGDVGFSRATLAAVSRCRFGRHQPKLIEPSVRTPSG